MRRVLLGILVAIAGCVSGSDEAGGGGDGTASSADRAAQGGDGPLAMPPQMSSGEDAAGEAGAAAPGGSAQSGPADGSEPGDAAPCPQLGGIFNAMYTEVSGTCGPVDEAARVSLDVGRGGTNTIVERRVGRDLTTEVTLAGCELRVTLTQVDSSTGEVQWRIESDPLDIESETRVTGQVTLTRFDAGGAIACSGVYDAVLTKNDVILGAGSGAAPPPGAGDPAGDGWSSMHVAEIEHDCTQTVQCGNQRGDALPDDPLASCIAATVQLLDANPDRQMGFLQTAERCADFIACQYVECALSDL